MSKNLSELSGKKGLNENLFEQLGLAARLAGSPSVEKMEELADAFVMGKANVFGAASFYDFLKPENKGKKVYICNGSSCLTAGTQEALKEKLLNHFKPDEIGEMCCLGRCHENSSFHINGKNYSGHAIDEIEQVKKNHSAVSDRYNVASYGTPVLTAAFPELKEYYTLLADALRKPADELLNELKLSGLRGRGGAGFPIAFKLDACKNAAGNQKFIVCNADEGDPGAYSDRYLLEQQPHSVLLGMMIAGYIAGANTGVVYIRAEYPESINITQKAIDDLHSLQLLGENILQPGFNFNFKVMG
ncbi:MAG: NAD(P)H-dependent oxidoreductase subunit E, partial [Bacteroidota bacterium]|nr:NAD(P)H-dependent oxidoreductase subunit E [Bacteroidota bacterium]